MADDAQAGPRYVTVNLAPADPDPGTFWAVMDTAVDSAQPYFYCQRCTQVNAQAICVWLNAA